MSKTHLLQNARGSGDRLRADIAQAIEAGKLRPGDRLAPIRILAKQYKLAFGTARNALGVLESEGLIERRTGSGTYVREARRVAKPVLTASSHVALLMDYQGHLFSRLAIQIVRDLQSEHLRCVPAFCGAERNALPVLKPMFDSWHNDPPRAVVFALYDDRIEQEIDRIVPATTRRVRVMQSDERLRQGWHSVRPDMRRVMELAVDHLLRRGHKRIGFATHGRAIDPVLRIAPSKAEHAREVLILGDVMRERGIRGALTIYTTHSPPDSDDARAQSDPMAPHNIKRAEQWLTRDPRPTAVICQSDYRAVAIRAAALNLGMKLPDDLELIGLGNTPWSHAFNFTSVNYNELEIGHQVAQLITASASELGSSSRRICVNPELMTRSGRSDAVAIPNHVPDYIS